MVFQKSDSRKIYIWSVQLQTARKLTNTLKMAYDQTTSIKIKKQKMTNLVMDA